MLRFLRPRRWGQVLLTVALATVLVLLGTFAFLERVRDDSRGWARDNLPLMAHVTMDRVAATIGFAHQALTDAWALRDGMSAEMLTRGLLLGGGIDMVLVTDENGRFLALGTGRAPPPEGPTPFLSSLVAAHADMALVGPHGRPWARPAPQTERPSEETPWSSVWDQQRFTWEHEGLFTRCFEGPKGSSDDRSPGRFALRFTLAEGKRSVSVWIAWERIQAILDRVNREMDQEGKKFQSGYLFLLQEEGDDFRVIGHKDLGLYDRLVKEIDRELADFSEQVGRRRPVIEYEFPRGVPKTSGMAYRELPGLNIALGAGINHADIFKTSTSLRNLSVAFVALVVLLATLSSVLLIRLLRTFRISVDQLTKSAESMAAGKFPEHVEVADDVELGKLATVVGQMADRLRQRHALTQSLEIPFQEIRPNPYIVGNPIRDGAMFFGRHEELEFARERLQGESGIALVFCGERRSGKTSILWQLRQGALGPAFRPALLDFQALEASVDEEEFFSSLREMIQDEVQEAEGLEVTAGQSPLLSFRRLVELIQDRLGERRLVLLFDEYEILDKLIAEGRVSASVIAVLASLLEASQPVSMVLTGSRPIKDRRNDVWEPLLLRSIYRWVGALSLEETRSLCTNPVAGRVTHDFGVVDRIVRLSAGHPYYTQVICQTLVDNLNRARRNLADKPVLASVVNEILEAPPPQMTYFWQRNLSVPERYTLAVLAEVLDSEGAFGTEERIFRQATGHPPSFEWTMSMLTSILTHQAGERFLDATDEGHRFRMDLFRLYIRKLHPVWQVLKEGGP